MIRKIKKNLEFFWIPLVLIIVVLVLIIGPRFNLDIIPNDKKLDFSIQLFATLFGVAIAIFIERGFQKRTEYLRIKKTFGLLKLVAIPYLKNQANNMTVTLKNYNDICSVEQAESFVRLGINFFEKATTFDKKWLELIYSQEFLDTIESDGQFNKVANAIFEILIYITTLTNSSINLNQFNETPSDFKNKEYESQVIRRTREIRDELKTSTNKLLKYIKRLEDEIDNFFNLSGTKYEEFER